MGETRSASIKSHSVDLHVNMYFKHWNKHKFVYNSCSNKQTWIHYLLVKSRYLIITSTWLLVKSDVFMEKSWFLAFYAETNPHFSVKPLCFSYKETASTSDGLGTTGFRSVLGISDSKVPASNMKNGTRGKLGELTIKTYQNFIPFEIPWEYHWDTMGIYQAS